LLRCWTSVNWLRFVKTDLLTPMRGLGSATSTPLENEQQLYNLPPKRGFIPSKPIERSVIQVGKPLEGMCQVATTIGIGRGLPGLVLVLISARVISITSSCLESRRTRQDGVWSCWRVPSDVARAIPVYYLGLKPHEVRFDRGCATNAPKQGRQSEHQLSIYGRLGVVVSDDRRFKTLVVFDIFDNLDDGFGAQPMSHRIATRPTFPFLCSRPGASLRIAPVSLKLPKRRHSPAAGRGSGPWVSALNWDCCQRRCAIWSGSILRCCHHKRSSPWRWIAP
jgi:hypothetical protein